MIEYFASGIVGALAMYGFLHGAKRVALGVWFWYGRREVRKADRAKAERRAERERNAAWSRARNSRWYEHERRAQMLMNEVAREFNANQEAA